MRISMDRVAYRSFAAGRGRGHSYRRPVETVLLLPYQIPGEHHLLVMDNISMLNAYDTHHTPGCSTQINKEKATVLPLLSTRRPLTRLSSPRSHVIFNRLGCKFDNTLLKNLLKTERQQTPTSPEYFTSIQVHLKPSMRRMCVQWMTEVCMSEFNEHSILCLSVSLMDRFLSIDPVYKTQLQTLASACLLISSKIVMPEPFSCDKLSAYTEYSVSASELMSWEMLVLSRLGWDVSGVTGIDFIQPLLSVLHLPPVLSNKLRPAAYECCQSFLLEHDMCSVDGSMQAAVAICIATTKIFGQDPELMDGLVTALQMAINCDMKLLDNVLDSAMTLFNIVDEEDVVTETKEDSVESDEGVCMDESNISSDDSMIIA